MNFNTHSDLKDKHAFLSPSNNHWLNYTPEKLEQVYNNQKNKEKGTVLHLFASIAIQERIKLGNAKKAINMFVNDAIGFKMISEQVLFHSYNAFGTADAISFKDNVLRIFDLKTGFSKVDFKQLDVYAALFCLEYGVDPRSITTIEQRLYQGNGYEVNIADPIYIQQVMERIVDFDVLLENIKSIR